MTNSYDHIYNWFKRLKKEKIEVVGLILGWCPEADQGEACR